MPRLHTPLEVYKLLPKSNCGLCRVSTCMAFAAAVIKEEKRLAECPHLGKDVVALFGETIDKQVNLETIQEGSVRDLKARLANIDLASSAGRLGGTVNNDGLVIKCLGRDFELDKQGSIKSHCHTHAWFAIPFLNYVLQSEGRAPSGNWVPFRELEQGRNWARLFEQRCEKPLREIADRYGALFEDLVSLFSGSSSRGLFSSDISVVLYPLPKVPMMICYWKPEDGMESKLHLFFDAAAEKNLPIDSLFTLAAGIANMLDKIMQKHGAADLRS